MKSNEPAVLSFTETKPIDQIVLRENGATFRKLRGYNNKGRFRVTGFGP